MGPTRHPGMALAMQKGRRHENALEGLKQKTPQIQIFAGFSDFFGLLRIESWCPREDSNLHALRRMDLNHVRLPIPPPGQGACTAKNAIIAGRFALSSILGSNVKRRCEP